MLRNFYMTNSQSFQSYLSLAIVFLVQFLQDGLQFVQEKVGVRWSEDQSWNQKQNGLVVLYTAMLVWTRCKGLYRR